MRRPPWVYAPSPEEAAERKAQAKAVKAAERWGVFHWEAANMYRTESAVRVFKRESAAQKDADARNEAAGLGQPAGDFVVRKLREEASR